MPDGIQAAMMEMILSSFLMVLAFAAGYIVRKVAFEDEPYDRHRLAELEMLQRLQEIEDHALEAAPAPGIYPTPWGHIEVVYEDRTTH